MTPTFAFLNLNPMEIIILLGLGVLLFGRKLPEMGKMLGKGLVEFKKGMSGMEDELMGSVNSTPRQHDPATMEAPRPPQRINPVAPKFEDQPSTNITTPPSV
jgi:sec-independent protein translocase protein TatA